MKVASWCRSGSFSQNFPAFLQKTFQNSGVKFFESPLKHHQKPFLLLIFELTSIHFLVHIPTQYNTWVYNRDSLAKWFVLFFPNLERDNIS